MRGLVFLRFNQNEKIFEYLKYTFVRIYTIYRTPWFPYIIISTNHDSYPISFCLQTELKVFFNFEFSNVMKEYIILY